MYFFMVAHGAACQTLSKVFFKSLKTWWRSCWCRRYFSQGIHRLKICSVVLLSALKPACSSVLISACGFNLFSMIFSMTGDSPVLWLYNSVQYSVHQFSISRSPVRHLPEWSWTVVDFPCFTMVKSITSWYALLLLFFPRFPAISWHCFSTQFSFAFFMHLVLLFSSLYFSDPFFLSSVLLSHRSRISAVTQDFLFLCSLPRIWLAVTVNCCDWLNSTHTVQH